MRIVIVDDEPLARSGLQARLADHEDMQVVGQCGTGKAAVTAIRDATVRTPSESRCRSYWKQA
jgi:two-component system LytT family response regulator